MPRNRDADFLRDYRAKWKMIKEAERKAAQARRQMQASGSSGSDRQRLITETPLANIVVST